MVLKVSTWNINSVRLRMPLVERFLSLENPDVLCLQEIKCREAEFPSAAFKKLGYRHIAVNAQKGYHGVAIVSRLPLDMLERREFCSKGDARHISAQINAGERGSFIVHNLYVPAGGDIADPTLNEKFLHKLNFLEELKHLAPSWSSNDVPSIITGDLNVAPSEFDVWNHKSLLKVVSHTPEETRRLNEILAAGNWLDAMRAITPEPEKLFTWWSYRSPDWSAANKGRRLDHIWLCPKFAPAVSAMRIHKDARSWEKPSDHVPVTVELT